MAYRNLTDVYILMRANSIANRNVFHDNQFSDDRTALVVDLENGSVKTASKLPPDWLSDVDEIQFEMTKIKNKLKELSTLHDRHLNRPTLDDNAYEERTIDALTQEITGTVGQCQGKIRKLAMRSNVENYKNAFTDKRLMKNVVSTLAFQLQELTTNFRKSQSTYLNKIKSRKERSNMLFDSNQYPSSSSAFMTEENANEDDNDFDLLSNRQQQLQVNRVNERLINERETEINHVLKSISDLNDLFKDLATMVVDQGTVLDRIDFNIERVSHSVDNGLVELQKAAKHQKASRKMYIITVLMIVFIVLFVLLLLTKF